MENNSNPKAPKKFEKPVQKNMAGGKNFSASKAAPKKVHKSTQRGK